MSTIDRQHTVLIASYLEPEHVDQIRAVDSRLRVIYEPDLLSVPRYASDHTAPPRALTSSQEAQWRGLLAQSDILFDFDHARAQELPELAPNVRWVQATSAGIGQYVKRLGYDRRWPNTVFTTASGVHAGPLAEFVVMAMLAHYRGLARLQQDQATHRWERHATTDMAGRVMLIVGFGKIGQQVARVAQALDMVVWGTKASPGPLAEADEIFGPEHLVELLPRADVVVLTVPHTPATNQLIGAAEFGVMKAGAFFVNIARGAVVDEAALIAALRSGQLGGAALDVFAQEPLPAGSPLWDLPNVLINSHSASTSDRENARIVDLFCRNLRRFLSGEPLINVLDPERYY